MRALLFAVVLCVLPAAAACRARPVTYAIPPGISASWTPSELRDSNEFARMFCSVLEKEFATEEWKSCEHYLRMAAHHTAEPLDDIPGGWTLLRLGGFGAECMARTAEAFADGGKHLECHGVRSYHVDLGAFDSSEDNAIRIRDFVLKHTELDKIIIVAHSKGAADAMVALTAYAPQLSRVKALITVAGAVGGSWLVDDFEGLNTRVLRKLSLPTCIPSRAKAQNAIDSMKRSNRQEFLAAHERLGVPSFSISAVSTRAQTSRILLPLWKRVAPYAVEQDSHIVEREAIVPGGVFLGRALGDHWAVAMPFNPNPRVRPSALEMIDQNVFPRPALLEAAVRVALARIAPKP